MWGIAFIRVIFKVSELAYVIKVFLAAILCILLYDYKYSFQRKMPHYDYDLILFLVYFFDIIDVHK